MNKGLLVFGVVLLVIRFFGENKEIGVHDY